MYQNLIIYIKSLRCLNIFKAEVLFQTISITLRTWVIALVISHEKGIGQPCANFPS